MKMLVTSALKELKLLDKRIIGEIDKSQFVCSAKDSDEKASPTTTKKEYCENALASFQSVNDLIARRDAIKNAVVESNANTMVTVCGQTLSVAKVIDMKTAIKYKEHLLKKMKTQYELAIAKTNMENIKVDAKVNDMINTMCGKDASKASGAKDSELIVSYRKQNEFSVLDPLKIEAKINELEKYIDEFKSSVDEILQISNCCTYVEIPD